MFFSIEHRRIGLMVDYERAWPSIAPYEISWVFASNVSGSREDGRCLAVKDGRYSAVEEGRYSVVEDGRYSAVEDGRGDTQSCRPGRSGESRRRTVKTGAVTAGEVKTGAENK
ncbi:hypothetical protein OUZ56_016780 [Daphnia magna]|uniref:Uncharacterized protein n=1 Tax=Daphnia magna TaxID=35525 RepID=A0ABR0ARZ5_9CRUS|nr:hypothetical protein OUZ56_016780 [Daphnia magna]